MKVQKLLTIIIAMVGTAVSLKCYVQNMKNTEDDGSSCKDGYEGGNRCYTECIEDDEYPSIYKRACKKITRVKNIGEYDGVWLLRSVVNKECGWQKEREGREPDIIHEIMNSQNTDKVDIDECSVRRCTVDETSVGCTGVDGKNFNDLCKNAIQKKFPNESQANCLKKLREEKIHSVCFCSTDYCNSANYLKSSLFLMFFMLMKPLFV